MFRLYVKLSSSSSINKNQKGNCNMLHDVTLVLDILKKKRWLEYRGADKSFARPGRKQARKHVRDERAFNNIETRAVIKFLLLKSQGAEGNSRHSDRNISLFSLPGRAKDLLAPPHPGGCDQLRMRDQPVGRGNWLWFRNHVVCHKNAILHAMLLTLHPISSKCSFYKMNA